MQDRDKTEEEKDTKNTGEKMQERNTTRQAKTEQTEEAKNNGARTGRKQRDSRTHR